MSFNPCIASFIAYVDSLDRDQNVQNVQFHLGSTLIASFTEKQRSTNKKICLC